jgi:hypothetical protein
MPVRYVHLRKNFKYYFFILFLYISPIYWYPSSYERTIRSVLKPSFYESSEWPSSYSSTSDDDDESDENPGKKI